MLILFFTIVFIAELIVLEKAVSSILKLKKQVCDLNTQVIAFRPQIKTGIKDVRVALAKILSKLNCFVTFVVEKRIDCGENIKRTLATKVLAFILKIPVKRIWAIVNTILTIRKFLKRL
jgi:hypothetical protein